MSRDILEIGNSEAFVTVRNVDTVSTLGRKTAQVSGFREAEELWAMEDERTESGEPLFSVAVAWQEVAP